jgi:hypothetical protein
LQAFFILNLKELACLKQMLMATVKDALEIMGYGGAEKIESEIFAISQKPF